MTPDDAAHPQNAELEKARAWFAAVSGALLDAGMAVSDETSYADAVRALAKERDDDRAGWQEVLEAESVARTHLMKERDEARAAVERLAAAAVDVGTLVTRLREQVAALRGQVLGLWGLVERYGNTGSFDSPVRKLCETAGANAAAVLAATAPPESAVEQPPPLGTPLALWKEWWARRGYPGEGESQ